MPRIYTSANDPLDFCQRHFPSYKKAVNDYGNVGEGPDGRGNCFEYDASHPTYDWGYRCTVCQCQLEESRDDYDGC